MWSVLSCYKQETKLVESSVLRARDAEESPLLEAVAWERLVKTQGWEKA
jgi:hypothetical protein